MKRVSVASVHDWFYLAAKALEAGFRVGPHAKGNVSLLLQPLRLDLEGLDGA